MEVKGHLLYYPEGKHDINLDNYVLKSQLNDALKSKVDSITKTTYANLKNLRDNSQLIPGSLYRITDYQCTTTQENTRSAGHQFDIVLLALSENKLAEEGWAMMHDNIYDVTFADGVTKKCYLYEQNINSFNIIDCSTLLGASKIGEGEFIINEDNKTITTNYYESPDLNEPDLPYNYFQNSNLSAWKVWYCLDNDKSRFAWADGGMIYINDYVYNRYPQSDSDDLYAWFNEDDGTVYTRSNCPKQGEIVYDTDKRPTSIVVSSFVSNGRGVIYRLIDEFNNDVGYDFKNIQFIRPLTDGEYDAQGTDTWCYTFAWNFDGIIVDGTIPDNNGNTWANYNKVNILYVNLLPNHVFIGGTYNCYIDVNSFSCTIINGKSVILHNCGELVHVDGNEQSAIYLNNKKVLTES